MQARNLLLTTALVSVIAFQLFANIDVDAVRRTEFILSMEPLAPRLPADNGKYYAILQLETADKNPVQAPSDIDIDILSSDPSVISVPERVTIKEGETFVKVDLHTTEKTGDVTITGLGAGASAGIAKVKTMRPEGLEPTKLAVYSAPSTMLPDPRFVGKIYVQLLNSQNLPAAAVKPVEVTLSSGDTNIVNVPSKVIIDEGASGTFVDFTPGIIAGPTIVTVSASDLASGKVTVTTVDLVGEEIDIDIAPGVMPADKGSDSLVTVQLLDSNGFPVRPSQSVMIFLKSSNDTVVTVPEDVIIDPGQFYVRTWVQAEGRVGGSEITAFASGYESDKVTIRTVEPATKGEKLVIYTTPDILPPDNTAHEAIVIQIQDKGGRPYRPAQSEFEILLTSSDTQIGSVDEGTKFESRFGSSVHYGIAKFTTRFDVGKVTITAAVTGYESDQEELEVKGPEAKSLKVSQIPPVMEADSQFHNAVVVQLLDDKNNPVAAPRDTLVELSSSLNNVVTVDPTVMIPEGRSYAVASVRTTAEGGRSTITASSQGLGSYSEPFNTSDPVTQKKLAVYAVPERLPADGETYDAVVVQLQDKAGNPAKAPYDIVVALSSSSMFAGSIDRSVIIPAGSTYATAKFTTLSTPDKTKIAASAQGYVSVSDDMETLLQPLTVTTSSIPRRLTEIRSIPMEVTVVSGDLPVKGAFVQVTGTNADVSTGVTDENGKAEVTFIPTAGGSNKVEVGVSKKGYKTAVSNFGLSITQFLNIEVKATTDGGRDIDARITVQPPTGKPLGLDSKVNKPALLKDVRPGTYTISVPEEVKKPDGIYKFEKWSDSVTGNPREANISYDSSLAAVYSASYLLHSSSPYGVMKGLGWYPEGSKVTLSIQPTSVSDFIIDRHFDGWSGDVNSKASTVQVVMDSPKSVIVNWKDDYTKLIGIVGGVAGVAGFFFYRKIKEKAPGGKKAKPPKLDWFKSE